MKSSVNSATGKQVLQYSNFSSVEFASCEQAFIHKRHGSGGRSHSSVARGRSEVAFHSHTRLIRS